MKTSWPERIASSTIHALLIFLPLLYTTSSDELFEFPKMLFVYAAAWILFGCFLADTIIQKKLRFPRTFLHIPILLFVLSQTVSTLFSVDIHTSLYGYYSRFNGGLFSVLSYAGIFYGALHFIRKENVFLYVRSLLIGAVLTALYAFPEHFGASPSCWLITGEWSVTCWVQDVQSRVFGTLGQPNWLAAFLVVVLPLTIPQMLFPNVSQLRKDTFAMLRYWAWPFAFLLFGSVLLFTKSRSGILGAGVALFVFSLLLFIDQLRSHTVRPAGVGKLLVPLIVLTIFIFAIGNPVRDKVYSVLHIQSTQSSASTQQAPTGTQLESGGSESGDIRKVVWTGALKVWLRYPVLGSGVETFAYSYYKDRPREHNLLSEWDFLYNKAHNEFLNYLATTGTVGFLSYLFLYGSFIVMPLYWAFFARPQEKPTDSTRMTLYAISSALVGLAVSNFFGFSTVVVSLLTFFLPALATVLAARATPVTVDLPQFLRGQNTKYVLCTIIVLISLWKLFSVFRLFDIDGEYAKAKTLISSNDVADGVDLLQDAVNRFPDEPVYRDELAYTAARLAYAFSQTGESTKSAQLAQAAIDHSDIVLSQNPANVNFYKTRVRIFTLLGRISPVFYDEAVKALLAARELSPTDPKLTYNLALIARSKDDLQSAEKYLQETLSLRPIDIQAQLDLGDVYADEKRTPDAITAYQRVLQLDPQNSDATAKIASLSGKKKK